MKPTEFVHSLEEQRVTAAIAAAEQKSSGEIRVYISNQKRHDVMDAAQKRFVKLGMTNTRQRNAVLLYFAPAVQQFAIIGDVGIHEKCGQPFWDEIVSEMTPLLKAGQFTDAVLRAIEHTGQLLSEHFPRTPDDINELPDKLLGD